MSPAEQRVIERLYTEAFPKIRDWLVTIVSPAEADDVLSETSLRLIREVQSGKTPTDRHAWRVATLRLTTHLAAAANAPLPLLEDGGRPGEARSFPTAEVAEFRATFDNTLRGLTPEARTAFALTELRGASEREAGALLGLSQPTVHRRAAEAREALRVALRGEI